MYKILVFLVVIYLFFRIFTRYLLPWFLQYYIKKTMKKNFGKTWENMTNSESSNKTNINIKPQRKTPVKKNKKEDNGEYVDFTEITEE